VACFRDSIMWHYQLFSSLGENHQGGTARAPHGRNSLFDFPRELLKVLA
jgi:hypothetical protein